MSSFKIVSFRKGSVKAARQLELIKLAIRALEVPAARVSGVSAGSVEVRNVELDFDEGVVRVDVCLSTDEADVVRECYDRPYSFSVVERASADL